jgi:hypothetical protein
VAPTLGPALVLTLALALALALCCAPARAQDGGDNEGLRRAESLIEALAQRGLLPRARADAMLREARARAGVAEPATPSAAAVRETATGDEVLRASIRRELREEVRAEVRKEVRDEVLASADALLRRGAGSRAQTAAAGAAPRPAPAAQPAPMTLVAAASAPAPSATPAPTPPATPSPTPAPTPPSTSATPPPAASTAPPATAPGVVRVPYVPQVVRDAIRNEVREDVLAQLRSEGVGSSAQAPEWIDRIKIDGDVRVRAQHDGYAKGNPSPDDFLVASLSGTTRAADLAAGTAAGLPTANTLNPRDRLRLRARLGVEAKVSDETSVALRLATGSATDRVSTNQTLGSDFNKYQFLLDRAWLRLAPLEGTALMLGRMPNPWFSTDLQWSENLAFDGIAATWRRRALGATTVEPFATAGWFPVRESAPPRGSRSLAGVQAGFDWAPDLTQRWRFGLAQYVYSNFDGRVDTDYDAVLGAGRSYGQYEYEAGLRQRGNTLFLTNSPLQVAAGLTPDKFLWGLASRFRPLALTVAGELSAFAPRTLLLSAELVKNTAFNRSEILARTGVQLADGSATGFGLRAALGATEVRWRGDWQASLGWRRVGSDAVLDAFTDSDLGLGGTNLSGWTLGFLWGLDRGSTVGVRYLSARTLDSPTVRPAAKDKYAIDVLQVDLNVRF